MEFMVAQKFETCEPFVADTACKRFLSGVRTPVTFQPTLGRESFLAELTREQFRLGRTLSRMRHMMALQLSHLLECLPAHKTSEVAFHNRSRSGHVRLLMPPQVARLSKGSAAHGAFERSLPGVDSAVSHEASVAG